MAIGFGSAGFFTVHGFRPEQGSHKAVFREDGFALPEPLNIGILRILITLIDAIMKRGAWCGCV
jgi:hypothetical protein